MLIPSDLERLSFFAIKQSKEALLWAKKSGAILYANPAAENLFGMDPGTAPGPSICDLIPDMDERSWKKIWQDLKDEQEIKFQFSHSRKANQILDLEVTLQKSGLEEIKYALVLAHDRTKELLLHEQVIENKRKLSTLMGNLPGMAYRCLFDENWTMEFVSQGCYKLTGYPPRDIIENREISYQDLIDPLDRDTVLKGVSEKIRHRKSFQLTYRIHTAANETKWVWEQGVGVFDHKGELEALEGFITDISEIKNIEHELIKKEKVLRELKDKLEEETVYLKEEIKLNTNFEEIITRSQKLRMVLTNIEKVASTESTVLILGETGTGKELVARAVHNNSKRSDRALIKVNCAALVPELIESELFGHEQGAFTGAYKSKPGRFELADKGTIFLDEIGELPAGLQVKILRVLQEGEFERLGNPRTVKTDVRIIAATNRDLAKAVEKGEFREDLYYRLNVFPVHIPPLRDRKEDIPLLIQFFVNKFARKTGKPIHEVSEKVIQHLSEYSWPGNVRELENIIERAIILSSGERLSMGNWLPSLRKKLPLEIATLQENEKQHILRALHSTNWRISGDRGAARLLGLKRTTLEARMKKLGITRPG